MDNCTLFENDNLEIASVVLHVEILKFGCGQLAVIHKSIKQS